MPVSLAAAAICAANRSSVPTSPPSASSAEFFCAQQLLELGCRLARLAAVRLVGDHGKALALRGCQLLHGLEGEWEGLDGAHHNLLAAAQRLGQLAALAAASPLMVATTPLVRSKSKMASCSCVVQSTCGRSPPARCRTAYGSVASCRSARKCAVQAIELVLPLPALCWIRYLCPALGQHGGLQLARGIELVVTREDEARHLLLAVALGDG